ncbi:mucin-19-like [Pseudophryne corroboree]|uniref:mucin-19-like n=1 Tax=Pseudophryne corroboree TaxID=495146 RepID=UPI003081E340
MTFVSGTQYIIHYGNASVSCCWNVTTTQTNATQWNMTGLSPGRVYTVTVQTLSGNCSQTSAGVTEATYPTPPGNVTFTTVGVNFITLSWGEPANMTGVIKTYNITYGNPSYTWTAASNTSNITLQSLISGTNYTITVVTVGARGYQSLPERGSIYTKPMSVMSLSASNVTSSTVSLMWSRPAEYKSTYTYRIQTNVTSPAVMIYNTIVTNESATIVNLTAGVTYTFMVYTRAGDNVTESVPVSLTTCTVPGLAANITLSNYMSVDVLGISWIKPSVNVDYYQVTLTGDINVTAQTNATQWNMTGLSPGRVYTVTVQTLSGNCSQTSAGVTEATYPTPPGNVTFTTVGVNFITLSWGEPANMTGVIKTYNITYGNPSYTWTAASNTSNITLQSLISGTNYTVTVVTVGARGYQSLPERGSIYTKPMSVMSLSASNVTSSSVSLMWSRPAEYKSTYTYRIQTNVISPAAMIYNTIVTNESATIVNLTAGVTYTFMVYTRAGDNVTESVPVSLTTCTVPGLAANITLSNYMSVDVLGISWIKPAGNVERYQVTLTGDINVTAQTNATQWNMTGLSPGRVYTVTVQTLSGNCSQTSAGVTEATYPTPPGNVTFTTVGVNFITLSWGEPANMTGVIKTYNITYGNPSYTWTAASNTSNITLQSLISGTNYTITVVTVGARGYQSLPERGSIYTKPMSVMSLSASNVTSSSVSLMWSRPAEYKSTYTYRIQTNVISPAAMIYNTIVTNESATIVNLTAGVTYTFMVYTRAGDNVTESVPVSLTTCTVPGLAANITLSNYMSVNVLGISWIKPSVNVDYYQVTLTGDINVTAQTNATQWNMTGLSPGRVYTVTVQTLSGNCSQTSAGVTEATYPTPPGNVTFTTVGVNFIKLSWGEPANMTGVIKTYNITYGNPSYTWTAASNTSNITLQSLISGTNYTVTVVTVGARGYQSLPERGSIYTSLPYQLTNVRAVLSSSGAAMNVTFLAFSSTDGPIVAYAVILTTEISGDGPTGGILSKTYRDFKNQTTSTYVSCVIDPRMSQSPEGSQEVDVRVGDETETHSYVNGPLDPHLQYRVSVAGFTTINYDLHSDTILEERSTVTYTNYTDSISATASAGADASNKVYIVGAVIGSFVVVSAVITLGCFFWRKKRQCKQNAEASSTGAPSSDSRRRRPAVRRESFEAMYNVLRANNNAGFMQEYASLQDVGRSQTTCLALRPANARKNRTDGVLLYDKTPVKLSTFHDSDMRHINASYIPGYRSKTEFIAAQSPLPGAGRVVWSLIWEKRINTIAVLSSCLEYGKGHSEQYWPSSEAKAFGDIIVTLMSEKILCDWTVRDFMVTNVKNNESRQVRQFHLTAWTENGDLSERAVLIHFVNLVRQHRKEYSATFPALVLCRAAAGRSGIFIALDRIINQLEDDNMVDVYGTVYDLHLHRPSMVQSEAQYIFLHQCTLDIIRVQAEAQSSLDYQTDKEERLYEELPNSLPSETPLQNEESVYDLCLNFPGLAANITLSNYMSVNVLGISWIKPSVNVDYYQVTLTGDINVTAQTNATQWNMTGLSPGRVYTVTVQTLSGYCSQTSAGVTEATYPTPPGNVTFTTVGVNFIKLSWGEPANMTGVIKTYNITYGNPSYTWTAASNTSNTTLQSLISGTNYTVTVVTVGARGYQSLPVSASVYTIPGLAANITLSNYMSVNVLGISWIKPSVNVDYYQVTLTGDINVTAQTNATQWNMTGLSPGRVYTVTVQTLSGNCSQTSAGVTEATYPTPPGNVTFITVGVNFITLSWGEPANMTGVIKTYNITYGNSSYTWTAASNTSNITLHSLISGTNYTVTVVTVGARGYQSLPVSVSVYTNPMSVNLLNTSNVTSSTVSLMWSRPAEYKSTYTYRIQTNVISPAAMIYNTIVTNESATIVNLTAGVTYTFMVYTRAGDNVTESVPVSLTTCTVPGLAANITLSNYMSVNVLGISWIKPSVNVDYYQVTLTGDINVTAQTNATQWNMTGLSPGRVYTVTVQTLSGNCSQTSAGVTEATYPTPPGNVTFTTVGVNFITLSWGEPANMTGVIKTYNITYGNSSYTWTAASNTSNITLQSLISGTNYTVTVVTVGARGYQSLPVSVSVYTNPMSVNLLNTSNVTSSTVSLMWSRPAEYKSTYTYRIQTNVISPAAMIYNTIVTNESATIVNLTAGVTYTFMVYTRAGDNVTESVPVSLTTCTVPGLAANITLSNYMSVNVLGISWIKPSVNVDYYQVTLTGDINVTAQTNATQWNMTGLSPGRVYTVTVQTLSGNCSQTSAGVTEATYPTPPGNVTFITVGVNFITLSWGEPANMTGVIKTYNITYGNSSYTWTAASNTSNITLQSLISGTNYTVTVVTVGARGYQSLPVSVSVYTNPMSVNLLNTSNVTSSTVSLMWSRPAEYKSTYTYRIQTNVISPAAMIYNTIVTNESATIVNLTAGVTYTFMVYTRAGDNVTESVPVSLTTCTVPGLAANITLSNYMSVNVLGISWIKPSVNVDYYQVTLTGDINVTAQTNATQWNMTGLSPGRVYTVTVQTLSGNCSQTSAGVTEATYPTPPGNVTFTTVGVNFITLSWGEPANMTGVIKTYNITYGNSSYTWTAASNTSNTTLQSLISGTNYTITVVTVGARGYQSLPVSAYVYTNPMSVNLLNTSNVTSSTVSLMWSRPAEYKSTYTYRIQTNVISPAAMIYNTIVTNESATIVNLTAGVTYTFMVYTRAGDNVTESVPVSLTTCTVPGLAANITLSNYMSVNVLGISWIKPSVNVDYYQVTLTGDINVTAQTNATQWNMTGLSPGRVYTVTVQTLSGNCSQTSAGVTEATYPTPPGNVTFTTVGVNFITLSWGEPANMTGVIKTYNITYGSSTYTWTAASNTSNITLQSLISGTNYTITVVTVGAREYQSLPVSAYVYTNPMSVNLLNTSNVTSSTVSLMWSRPAEYKSTYTYRIQTNVISPAAMIYNTIVTNESATIVNLTAGVTYTFMVYTRAGDNVTESVPVSLTTCTVPGLAANITLSNYMSVNVLGISWIKPSVNVDYYQVTLTGDINVTAQTNATQWNMTGLSPGRVYTVTVLTLSGNCSQTSAGVTEATYPTPPGNVTFTTVGVNFITLSWGEPANMTGVIKTCNITYGNSSYTWTAASNTSNITLQSLISGTNYTITVVTVGARGYQSLPVSASVYTNPMSVNLLNTSNVTSSTVSLMWSRPAEYKYTYTYRIQTNVISPAAMIYNTIVTNESATIVNLTAGVTYTFMVYTRAGDNVTESVPVSLTTCTVPGLAANITLSNYMSVNVLGISWIKPSVNVDYYQVTLTGDINVTAQTNATQWNTTGLSPGRVYTVTVQTLSGNCSQTSAGVTEATYPTQPGNVTFTTVGVNFITLSWGEPANMTGVIKTYNITYGNSSYTWTAASNTSNITLQSLISGTNYTITVVTVGARGYQSLPVSAYVYTNPMSVNLLNTSNVTSSTVSLMWSRPAEYKSTYTYRIQTNVISPAAMIYNTIVTNESATIVNLTAGVTYTFMVYTRAGDNVTESVPVSLTTCTVPGLAANITLSNYMSVNVLGISWIKPSVNVDYYQVTLTGDINVTAQTNATQWNMTGLSPGRVYTVTVQTLSGNCSQTSAGVTEATYPTPPGNVTFTTVGVNFITLSWGEPANVTGVIKTYNITYGNSSYTWTAASNTSNITLQSLISGTNYTITVVTVGARGYQSLPVSVSVYTNPMSVNLLNTSNVTSSTVSLMWSRPAEYKSTYTYRIQTNVISPAAMIYNTIVTNESATIVNLTAGVTYTFMVYTRAGDNVTESVPVSLTTCTVPGLAANITLSNYMSVNVLGISWIKPSGNVDYYQVTLTGDINVTAQTNATQWNMTGLSPGRVYTVTVQTLSGNCSQTSAGVTEATYPTPPGNVTFTTVGVNFITLSWGEPANMTGVIKTYNITYGNSSYTWTAASNTSNITLQSLISGTNYTVTVVTVGARGYQSLPVSASVYTNPMSVNLLNTSNVTSSSVSLMWSRPAEYKSTYTYRIQTNVISPAAMIYNTIVTNESATIVNLTAGVTYTFMVYTRAGDNVTESVPVSLTTCTVPGLAANITLSNYMSVNVLGISWIKPSVNVDYYQVTLTGDINVTAQTNATQWNMTGLSPGRVYTVTVQTLSGNCSQTSAGVTEATYPTPPGNVTFTTVGVNFITLSWGEPANMTGVIKTYNITYGSSTYTWTAASNTSNTTLQSLISGTNYTITVVTVGARGYQSLPVSAYVYTKPMPVTSLINGPSSMVSVPLFWSRPAEYSSSYTYRIQTNVISPAAMIYNTIVTNESATIVNLTAGVTYTFMVYTRAGDNVTESDPVSLTTCTVPGLAANITLNNYMSVNVLGISWIKPSGNVDYYQVTLTGDINVTAQTNATQWNMTGLSPGRVYTVTVQTLSGNCSQTSAGVTEATYPTPPGNVTFTTVGVNFITLSWGEPANMTGVIKTYNITYGNPSYTWTAASNTSNITLQSLISGTNYTVTVVTVGARGYQSLPVSASVYTKPMPVTSLINGPSSMVSVPLFWSRPAEYSSSYTYRIQTNVISPAAMIYNTIVTNESATIVNLTAGVTYTFMVYTRAGDNVTESDPVSLTTCTVPEPASGFNCSPQTDSSTLLLRWECPMGIYTSFKLNVSDGTSENLPITNCSVVEKNFTNFKPYTIYTFNLTTLSCDKSSMVVQTQCQTSLAPPPGPTQVSLVTANPPSYNSIDFTFPAFDNTNGPISAYAVIVSDTNGGTPPRSIVSKTYTDYTNKNTNSYVAKIINNSGRRRRSTRANSIAAKVGDGTTTESYVNGPLKPLSSYWGLVIISHVRVTHAETKLTNVFGCCSLLRRRRRESGTRHYLLSLSDNPLVLDMLDTRKCWNRVIARKAPGTMMQSRQTTQVRHFHFTAWPDHGVPKTTNDLIQFRNLIRQYTASYCPPSSPILVHCSAGVGRTGTFIALDRIIKQIEAEDRIDVYAIVHDLRMHRGLMVQTDSQYVFLNKCALDFINSRKSSDPDLSYQNSSSIYENFNVAPLR